MLDTSRVLAVACRLANVTMLELCGPKRTKGLARARRLVCWVLYRKSNLTLAVIGKLICRDPSTVFAAVRQVDLRLAAHEDLLGRLQVEARDPSMMPLALQAAIAARSAAENLRTLATALEAGHEVDETLAQRVLDSAATTIGLANTAVRGAA